MSVNKQIAPEFKVKVTNLADWDVSVKSQFSANGAIVVPGKGSSHITFADLESASSQGHKIVCGVDGAGSHARVYIENADVRMALGFDNPEENITQLVITKDRVKEIFAIKRFEDFKKAFNALVVEPFEKYAVMRHIADLKINDFSKIRYAEQATGIRL